MWCTAAVPALIPHHDDDNSENGWPTVMLEQTVDASMEQTKTHKGLAVGVAATKLKLQEQVKMNKGKGGH